MAHNKQEEICQMFDRIARTYDRVNRLLSWGQDRKWRQYLATQLPKYNEISVLDVATGTADLLIAMSQVRSGLSMWGIDLSANMLALAKAKIDRLAQDQNINLHLADACALPFADDFFDCVTIAFGIRNVSNMPAALNEMARVLKPQGRMYILEFSLPTNVIIKFGYLAYFRYWLPLVGGLISGEKQAYKYLNRTVEGFPKPDVFCELIRKAGFSHIETTSLSGGIATLYSAGIA